MSCNCESCKDHEYRNHFLLGMLVILFLAVILSCCASQPIHPVMRNNRQEIGLVTRWIEKELDTTIPKGWNIRLVDHWIVKLDPANRKFYFADGLTDPSNHLVLVYDYQPCLGASALPHELMHVLGYKDGDEIIKTIEEKAILDLCGADYQKSRPPQPTDKEILDAANELYSILEVQNSLERPH